MNPCFVVAIAGGTGSGKGYFAKLLAERFPHQTLVISLDMYYKDQGTRPLGERQATNVDSPAAFDFELLYRNLTAVIGSKPARQPIYDYQNRTRKKETTVLKPEPLIIVEGLLALSDPRLLPLYNLKIYLEADADLRLARRLLRDQQEKRHETLSFSINQYLTSARPSHKIFVEPQKVRADIVIDWNEENKAAFEQVVGLIQKGL